MSKTKMVRVVVFIGIIIPFVLSVSVHGKSVNISSPSEWYTVRGDSLAVKGVIDTSVEINTNLYLYGVTSAGRKLLKKKPLENTKPDFEITFSAEGLFTYSGKDYLVLEWRNEVDTGGVFPLCVVNEDKKSEHTKEVIKRSGGIKPGKIEFAEDETFKLFWDDKNLYFVCKQEIIGDSEIMFGIDGENGKKGFLGYADRIAAYDPDKDSADLYYFKREKSRAGIEYKRGFWYQHDMEMSSEDDLLLITLPFHEVVVKPVSGRVMGFAVFNGYTKDSGIFPDDAYLFSPVTWGNMVLRDK